MNTEGSSGPWNRCLCLLTTCLAGTCAAFAGIDYDPHPFGTGPGIHLDTVATGQWWKMEGKTEMERFILEQPRDQTIAYALYTHGDGILKMTVQTFPLLPDEPHHVILEIQDGSGWSVIDRQPVLYPGWSAHFRVEDWDGARSVNYRVRLDELSSFEGLIRRDPIDKEEIIVASMSCNSPHDETLYQRSEYVRNLLHHDPDLLFFAGDQSYHHEEHTYALLQWGLQFADVLRDRPVVTIPDDHDVGQYNLWGEGGIAADSMHGDSGGYYYPATYVKMVERCQTFHLPDPYDPTPVEQGIGVYYTSLCLGGIDMAILEDRKFKSGPKGKIPQMGPRPDHIRDEAYDRDSIDLPGLELLGERQLKFLHEWGQDWTGAEMKTVLSQTAFCGAVHLHGKFEDRLLADLDCNGWPQTGRNRALREIRRCMATHLCGDQHLAVAVQHGIDTYRDGPYAFTNPALVNTIYARWWSPQDGKAGGGEAISGSLPWTGDYEDGLGNKITMLAYANPIYRSMQELKEHRDSRGDGYGIIRFNKKTRRIVFECWPRFSDASKGDSQQFEGWPVVFSMEDNDGRALLGFLPELKFNTENPVVQVIEERTGEILYTIRVSGTRFRPRVFAEGSYTVRAGFDRPGIWEKSGLRVPVEPGAEAMDVRMK